MSTPLTRADTAWLHAEEPTNHFVVTSLAVLDEPPRLDRIRALLGRRLALHPRLTQVVREPRLPFLPQTWVPAEAFSIDAHVQRVALPRPGGRAELEEFIGGLVGRPMDFGRPLWDLYLVEGLQLDGHPRGALVSRFHHALGDGHAMVRMLMTLTDSAPAGWRRPIPRRSTRNGHARRRGVVANLDSAARLAARLPELPEGARWSASAAGALARLTLMGGDESTPLRGPLGMVKRVAWSRPTPVAEVREIARATGTKINDVLVSAIAGAFGTYLRRSGVATEGLRIRAMVPYSLRDETDTEMAGNRFSLVYLELPVDLAHPVERLLRVKSEMDRIKASPEPAVGWLLVQGLGILPAPVEHLVSGFYADKATLVLTNVVGPNRPLYVAGSRIREMSFWEPESGGLGVGASIFSYDGQVSIGLVSDARRLARPALVCEAFSDALADLGRHAAAFTGD